MDDRESGKCCQWRNRFPRFYATQVRSKRELLQIKDASHYSVHIDSLSTQVLDHELSLKDMSDMIETMKRAFDRDRKQIEDMKHSTTSLIIKYPAHSAKSTMDLAIEEVKLDSTKKSDYTSNEQHELFDRAGGWTEVKAEAKKGKIF